MTYFIHLANLVFLYSYTVKDIKKLRLINIIGTLFCIPYYLILGRYEAIAWSGVFLTINTYRLICLSREQDDDHFG